MDKLIKNTRGTFSGRKIVYLLAAVILISFILKLGKKGEAFKAAKVEKGKIETIVTASGTVRSENQVKVQFQTSGRLAWLGAKEGDSVRKWQSLASLDKEDLKKRFQKEMNDYLNERWDFEQTQDDYKLTKEKSLVTDSIKRILEKAQFDLNNSVLDLEISDLAVKYATIHSPIDGIVTAIEPSVPGLNVLYTSAYIEVADPSKMEFEAIVDEVDVAQIQVGQEATVTLDAFSDKEFFGKVKRVAFKSSITKSGGTGYSVFVSVPEDLSDKLKIGFNGEIKVITSQKENVLLLPLEALIEEEEGNSVFRFIGGRAIKTPVKAGLINDISAEIVEGLTESDLVLVEKIASIKDGQKISIEKIN